MDYRTLLNRFRDGIEQLHIIEYCDENEASDEFILGFIEEAREVVRRRRLRDGMENHEPTR